MAGSPAHNFAGQIVAALGKRSCLIDASTGETVLPGDLPQLIFNFGPACSRRD